MKLKSYTELIACPDCKGDIKNIDIDHQLLGFFCEICKLIYPVKEKIFILLSKSARNYTLEYDLVESIKKKSFSYPTEQLKQYINNTLNLLDSSKDVKSWEWKIEEFWSKEYEKEKEAILQKNWNDRIWQREVLLKNLLDETKFIGKTILDVGCGEGQNFKSLFVDHCDESTLYIASDISLAGLKLNHSRNKHKNSLYVLCSADKLPFHIEKIDILCYFEMLQYNERRVRTIPKDSKLVKRNGYIVITQTLNRPTVSSFLSKFLQPKIEKRIHEHGVNVKELLAQINNNKNLEIITSIKMHTIFYGFMIRFFPDVMTNNKAFFHFIYKLDIIFLRLFGRILPFFKEGEIMLLGLKS